MRGPTSGSLGSSGLLILRQPVNWSFYINNDPPTPRLSGLDERTIGRRAMLAVAGPESDTAIRGSR
jgi:hypothetical protein